MRCLFFMPHYCKPEGLRYFPCRKVNIFIMNSNINNFSQNSFSINNRYIMGSRGPLSPIETASPAPRGNNAPGAADKNVGSTVVSTAGSNAGNTARGGSPLLPIYRIFPGMSAMRSLLLAAIFLLSFIFTSGAIFAQQDKTDTFTQAKLLMRGGKFREARKLLMDYHAPKEESKRVEGFIAVTSYADPDWFPGDVAQLKKYADVTVPLMTDLIGAAPQAKTGPEIKNWIDMSRIKFMRALSEMGSNKAASSFKKALGDKDPRIRLSAVEAMGKLKDPSVAKTLMEFLKKEYTPDYSIGNVEMQVNIDKQARITAVAVIARNQDPSVVKELKEDLKKTSSPDRISAATILTGYRSAAYLDVYRSLLKDNDENLKIYAASSLKELGLDDGLPVLKDMFTNGSDLMKLRLIDILSWWKNADVAQFFLDYLKEQGKDNKIGFVPLSHLGKVPDLSEVATPDVMVYLRIMQTLMDWDKITPPLVLGELEKSEGNFRYIAAEILGETQWKPAIEKFRGNLDSKDPVTVYYSVWALGRMGDKESLPKIEKLLTAGDKHIRAAAAWSLARMGSNKGENTALGNLSDKDPALSATAMDTLYYIRNKSDSAKIEASLSGNLDFLKTEAVRLLGIMNRAQFTPGALKMLEIPGSQAFYTAESLFRTGGKPVKFAINERYRKDRLFYGNNVYDEMDYARYVLLYFSLKPGVFGEIRDTSWGDITPLYRYGEYGKIEDQSPANPFVNDAKEKSGNVEDKKEESANPATGAENSASGTEGSENEDSEKTEETVTEVVESSGTGDLTPGMTVVLREFKGRNSSVALPDGREGRTFTAGLDLTENVIAVTKARMQKDLGFRRDEELEKILEEDYLKGVKFDIKNEDPAGYEASLMTKAALDMAMTFSGIDNPPSTLWDKVVTEINKGRKTITLTNPVGKGEWKFMFDGVGKVMGVKLGK